MVLYNIWNTLIISLIKPVSWKIQLCMTNFHVLEKKSFLLLVGFRLLNHKWTSVHWDLNLDIRFPFLFIKVKRGLIKFRCQESKLNYNRALHRFWCLGPKYETLSDSHHYREGWFQLWLDQKQFGHFLKKKSSLMRFFLHRVVSCIGDQCFKIEFPFCLNLMPIPKTKGVCWRYWIVIAVHCSTDQLEVLFILLIF